MANLFNNTGIKAWVGDLDNNKLKAVANSATHLIKSEDGTSSGPAAEADDKHQ